MTKTFKDFQTNDLAWDALKKKCYNPISTQKTRTKIGEAVAVGLTGLILAPIAVAFTGPAAPLVCFYVNLGVKGGFEAGSKNAKHIGTKPAASLNRGTIKSKVMHSGVTLKQLAGDRAGTRGTLPIQDLLPCIFSHLGKAVKAWNSKPFRPGGNCVVSNTEDAMALYAKFASVDYHFSKAAFYTERLEEICNTLKGYNSRCENTIKTGWDGKALKRINDEIQRQQRQQRQHR
jgi:hypothetical protein